MALLEAKNICKSFEKTEVLRGIDLCLDKGQTLSIIGSSGSGKTTLLRCLNFLEKPDRGTITVAGETLFDTVWPATAAGETAHVACVGDATQTRDRLCQKNGQWDNVMTGGCACSAETYRGVQWGETDGGSMGALSLTLISV